MLKLKDFRSTAKGLPDLLHCVAERRLLSIAINF